MLKWGRWVCSHDDCERLYGPAMDWGIHDSSGFALRAWYDHKSQVGCHPWWGPGDISHEKRDVFKALQCMYCLPPLAWTYIVVIFNYVGTHQYYTLGMHPDVVICNADPANRRGVMLGTLKQAEMFSSSKAYTASAWQRFERSSLIIKA